MRGQWGCWGCRSLGGPWGCGVTSSPPSPDVPMLSPQTCLTRRCWGTRRSGRRAWRGLRSPAWGTATPRPPTTGHGVALSPPPSPSPSRFPAASLLCSVFPIPVPSLSPCPPSLSTAPRCFCVLVSPPRPLAVSTSPCLCQRPPTRIPVTSSCRPRVPPRPSPCCVPPLSPLPHPHPLPSLHVPPSCAGAVPVPSPAQRCAAGLAVPGQALHRPVVGRHRRGNGAGL